jgi:hypothetical protein
MIGPLVFCRVAGQGLAAADAAAAARRASDNAANAARHAAVAGSRRDHAGTSAHGACACLRVRAASAALRVRASSAARGCCPAARFTARFAATSREREGAGEGSKD